MICLYSLAANGRREVFKDTFPNFIVVLISPFKRHVCSTENKMNNTFSLAANVEAVFRQGKL